MFNQPCGQSFSSASVFDMQSSLNCNETMLMEEQQDETQAMQTKAPSSVMPQSLTTKKVNHQKQKLQLSSSSSHCSEIHIFYNVIPLLWNEQRLETI